MHPSIVRHRVRLLDSRRPRLHARHYLHIMRDATRIDACQRVHCMHALESHVSLPDDLVLDHSQETPHQVVWLLTHEGLFSADGLST